MSYVDSFRSFLTKQAGLFVHSQDVFEEVSKSVRSICRTVAVDLEFKVSSIVIDDHFNQSIDCVGRCRI